MLIISFLIALALAVYLVVTLLARCWGLTVLNFVSPATGIAVAMALCMSWAIFGSI